MYIDPARMNDPVSSPVQFGLDEVTKFLPFALALLSNDSFADAKRSLRTWADEDPMDALGAVVLGGGIAFYLAERDSNPGCQSPLDGILYMSTALAVGYDNLFPTTATGHALATFAQTFGPALTNAAFEPPAAERRAAEAAKAAKDAEAAEVNRQILARLEDIVRLLETDKS